MKTIKNHINTDHSPKQKELPAGWILSKLNDISDINPRFDKTKIPDDSLVVFVPMASVGAGDGKVDISQKRYFSEVKKGFTPFQSGDIIFAKITPCMENGKIAVVPHLENQYGFGSTEFHVIRPKTNVDAHYIYYFLSRLDCRKEAASKMTGAVGQKRVPVDFIKTSSIPVAPPNEQKRIVAEIEKQFSRLDEAVAALKRIKANLKRYKASVLKAAIEGKLTEEWRKTHPDIEPASELLKRILIERRKKWEEEYIKKYVGAHGHALKDDSWKKKYKEPALPDTANLPELPEGWVWTNVGQISESMKNGIYKPLSSYADKGVACLRMYNIENGKIVWKDIKRMLLDKDEIEEYQLLPGDLLVNRVNSRELVGKAAPILKDLEDCVFESKNIRVRLLSEFANTNFISYIFILTGQSFFNRNAQQVVGMASISQPQVSSLPIPLPTLCEQNIIVNEVESRLSVIDEVENEVELNLKRAERLRQSILKKAFSGKLVPQELDEELASESLEKTKVPKEKPVKVGHE